MLSLPLLWFLGTDTDSLSSSTYLLWYVVYAVLFALFYVFSSPFTGNRSVPTPPAHPARVHMR
jgi:hypothetical protein